MTTHTHDLDPSCIERTLPDGTVRGACLDDRLAAAVAGLVIVPLEDEPSSVASVVEWLEDTADVLSGLLDQLHELKRAGSDEHHRLALLTAADQTSRAWSYARMALTTLTTDVRP